MAGIRWEWWGKLSVGGWPRKAAIQLWEMPIPNISHSCTAACRPQIPAGSFPHHSHQIPAVQRKLGFVESLSFSTTEHGGGNGIREPTAKTDRSLKSVMLPLFCCECTCKYVYSHNHPYHNGFFYPHTVSWKCNATGPRDHHDQFNELFSNLPHEMKVKCLSYCSYFALVNREIWLQDFDTVFFKRLMRDPHFKRCSNSCQVVRRGFSGVVLNTNQCVMRIGFRETPPHIPQRSTPSLYTVRKRKCTPYGDFNRYPSSFY